MVLSTVIELSGITTGEQGGEGATREMVGLATGERGGGDGAMREFAGLVA